MQCISIRLRVESERPVEQVDHALRELLERGCQPLEVSLETDGTLEMHRRNGLQLLRRLAEASSVAPLPTQELEVTLPALTAETAALILSAFPRLERLKPGWWEPEEDDPASLKREKQVHAAFAAALQLLLDGERGAPHLAFLDLLYAPNTPVVRRALSGATQLTGLKLGVVDTAEEIQAFTTLTSLRTLEVTCEVDPVLQALLSPLTALTSLRLRGDGHLSPALAGLPRLASLDYSTGHLDVSVLATLTALTKLRVSALTLPEAAGDAFEALAAPVHPHPWQLPPQLKSIVLDFQAPEPLYALRSSPVQKLTWFIDRVQLEEDTHLDYSDDDEEGQAVTLTPHGEAALCALADFLAGRLDEDSWIGMVTAAEQGSLPIRCVGGAEEAGPGRRSHTVWLEAMGRAGIPQLELNCLALNYQDFGALAGHTGLKVLQLGEYLQYPLSALLSLPLMPSLERLELNGDLWCPYTGEDDGRAEAAAAATVLPPDLPGVLTALLCMGRRLRVDLLYVEDDGPEARARRVQTALAADVRSSVERLGGDGGRLRARGV
ncbi:hypothetical protein HYH03_019075 [Edaphochlamys debaryana]|uniref:Uncharacterized protein n=1 Tax=Edaphochlamys debaryana TaxID=47281 RepID=A0A835XDG9_9CHLO|nr:hypothetical protein HYH03_019075 [Edaphochlamys debaryana]|eukprot:KAG2481968.1 hypothetical protein HYH03_019075 [Edaphochlamys debaryana]